MKLPGLRCIVGIKENLPLQLLYPWLQREMVRVARFELAASWSQTKRPTSWATPGYSVDVFRKVVKNVVKRWFWPGKRRIQEEKALVRQWVFGAARFYGNLCVPAPKPSAIPNFAKPGYEVKIFSDVVKGYFSPEQGRSQEEKVLAPQRVFRLLILRVQTVLQLPNQAPYQLGHTRIWNSTLRIIHNDWEKSNQKFLQRRRNSGWKGETGCVS